MHEEEGAHARWVLAIEIAEQLLPVAVRAIELHAKHLGIHRHGLAEDPHLACAAEQLVAKGARRAEAHRQHGIIRVGQGMEQVVAHPAGLHHAAGADDDAGLLRSIQALALLRFAYERYSGKGEEVGVAVQFITHFGPEERGVPADDVGGTDGQRAVHEDRYARQAPRVAQGVQRVEDLLGLADAERGDDEPALAINANAGHMPKQFFLGFGHVGMFTVAVSALADDRIGLRKGRRRWQQAVHVSAHIAGEGDAPAALAIVDAQVHGGAAQDMPGIGEGELDPGQHLDALLIGRRLEERHGGLHIVHGVQRPFGGHGLAALLRASHRIREIIFLDPGAVLEHDGAEVASGRRAPDGAFEALGHQTGQQAAVVDVRMAQHHGIDRLRIESEAPVAVLPIAVREGLALEHAAIEEHARGAAIGACQFEQVLAPGHGAGSAVEGDVEGHGGEGRAWQATSGRSAATGPGASGAACACSAPPRRCRCLADPACRCAPGRCCG